MPGCLIGLTTNPVVRQGVHIYFLTKAPLSVALNFLLTLCIVLFVIWPKSQYLRIGSPPLTFGVLAITATLITTYLSFSYGSGSLVEGPEPDFRTWLVAQHSHVRGAFGGLTFVTTAHTVFLLALPLPLLLAASHVSGITWHAFAETCALMVVCALAYRWLGLLALCLWVPQEFLRYVVARGAFVLFVLGSAFFLPPLNPLRGLISISFGDELGQVVPLFGRQASYADVSLIIHLLLLLASYIMVRVLIKRWVRDTPVSDHARGESLGERGARG
ncbi:MAG: hypothetical protein HYZ81_00695 [Nitrospinae bacterium]|nr:hypothetical protein [Nitrospinota bacterium]